MTIIHSLPAYLATGMNESLYIYGTLLFVLPIEAVMCFQQAIEIYTDMVRDVYVWYCNVVNVY